MRFLFFTEAGEGRGSGHVIRCSAIAEALAELGIGADFVIDCPPDFQSPVPFRRLRWQTETEDLRQIITDSYSGIFIDSYDIDTAQIRRIASCGLAMFYLDDLQAVDFPQGTIFSPFPGKAYVKRPGHLLYTGPDYMPLRKAFAELQSVPHENREGILITFGGSRQDGLINTVLDALSDRVEKITLVADIPPRDGVEVIFSLSAEEMADLMTKHRFIICAGGGTLNEAARAGIPATVVKIADNQNHYTDFWKKAGFAFLAGVKGDEMLKPAIRACLEKLSDESTWLSASKAGALCDGLGAKRIARTMVAQLETAKKGVLLRENYRMGSAYLKNYTNCDEVEHKRILEDRNSQAVRQNNTNSVPMGLLMWKSFMKSLQTSHASGYWLVYDRLDLVGSFSLTSVNWPEGGAVLGFYKNPGLRQKGIGQLLCKLAGELAFSKLGLNYVVAGCFQSNMPSRKSMERAGFRHLYNSEDSKGRVIMHYELMKI